ncbi:S24 family peptidase [Prosthecomicrobium sp. N25]|uniref:S24 family peptidase n=1 Tax=Prosthecomicrobium sp. N25 TaxID=3129254 RepID=UPI003077E092
MTGDRGATFSHERLWAAIDACAARHGLTASGLARRAGLDATTFNRSKRRSGDGRPRWPSTESIAKILEATGTGLDEFMALLGERDPAAAAGSLPAAVSVPFLDLREAGDPGSFDPIGMPVRTRWDSVVFPGHPADALYALEVTGDDLMPLYRNGDVIIVSATADIRRGDRVIVRSTDGILSARIMVRRTATAVEVDRIAPPGGRDKLRSDEVAWMARIVWASQ